MSEQPTTPAGRGRGRGRPPAAASGAADPATQAPGAATGTRGARKTATTGTGSRSARTRGGAGAGAVAPAARTREPRKTAAGAPASTAAVPDTTTAAAPASGPAGWAPGSTPAPGYVTTQRAGFHRRPLAKIGLGLFVLVGLGILFKSLVFPGPSGPCVYSCARPPSGTPQPAGATFVSNQFGFSFSYPPGATLQSVSAPAVANLLYQQGNSFGGQALVVAGTGNVSPQSLITNEANTLASEQQITGMQTTGPLNGAEIGFQPGVGELYSANYMDANGNEYPVQIGIVAVQHGPDWEYLVGISTLSASSNTPLYAGNFDDILDRWQWTR